MSGKDDIEFSVGPGTIVSVATIHVTGTALIAGRFEGRLSADRTVVSHSGSVFGALSGTHLEVHGRVEGDTDMNGHVLIGRSGALVGTLSYDRLTVDTGGRISGSVAPREEANRLAPHRHASDPEASAPPISSGSAAHPPVAELSKPEPEPAPDTPGPPRRPRARTTGEDSPGEASGSSVRPAKRPAAKPKDATSPKAGAKHTRRSRSRPKASTAKGGTGKT